MVLVGIQWKSCLVYIDDIIIVGKSFEQHTTNGSAGWVTVRVERTPFLDRNSSTSPIRLRGRGQSQLATCMKK